MILHKSHLFLILLAVLLFSNLGLIIREGATSFEDLQAERDSQDDEMKKGGPDTLDEIKGFWGPKDEAIEDAADANRGGNRDYEGVYGETSEEGYTADNTADDEVESKYILKSSIVPPVCPKCPDAAQCPRQKPCPPCPACARCPEQPFTCKKVPDYNAVDTRQLPKPVLTNFSKFSS